MAAHMGLSPEILETDKFPPDKIVDGGGGRDSLMERLRGRVGQHRSWTDTVKTLKLIQMNDKHRQSNSIDKSCLQTCLDKLHRAMKITNQQTLIERLDLISRQLGMIFTPSTVSDNQVALTSEMFKVIVIFDGQSGVRDVKISHQDTPTSCEELVDVLRKGDFDEFISHLQGLLSIYSFNGDKKQKSKGYLALSTLEHDLNLIAQLQSSINGVTNYIHKSSLGILLPRRGGHPMKLIYYVSPYDLLCKKSKSTYPMTLEAITENDLGHSVTVCIEPSNSSNKLQTMPLTSVMVQDGKRMPSVQGVSMINSSPLAASFVLVLPQAVPVSQSIIEGIKEITGQDLVHDSAKPFLSLLLQHSSESKIIDTKELFVTLPDQQHVYYLNQSRDGILSGEGCLVRKIPFTHPTMVPSVLNLLRQQLVFNSVLSSIIRPLSRKDHASSLVFELMTVSLQYLSVMFEHPLRHSLITVEFNLSDITNVQCKMCTINRDASICPDDFISKVFQRCFSVPVTLRSVIKRVQEDIRKLAPPLPVTKPVVKSRLTWHKHLQYQAMLARNITNNINYKTPLVTAPVPVTSSPVLVSSLTSLPNPPPYPGCELWVSQAGQQQPRLEINKYSIGFTRPFETINSESVSSVAMEERHDRPPANPLLATLLDAGSPAAFAEIPSSQSIISDSPMLSKLLEENTSVATNPFPPPNQRKRLVKRKSSKDVTAAGKSPKHRVSESEMVERTSERTNHERHGQGLGEKHIDLDSSGGSYDDPMRPPSASSVCSLGPQSDGSVIDLTDSFGESHVKKLENSLDSFINKESPHSAMGLSHQLNQMNNQFSSFEDLLGFSFPDFTNPNQNHPNATNPMLLDGGMDFQTPQPQWVSRQTPPTTNSRGSPHHGVLPKNEKTSTSLEDLLQGPRGREKDGPSPVMHMRQNLQQHKRQNFKQRHGRNSVESSGGVSPDGFSPLMTSPSHHPLASPGGQFPMPSPTGYIISPGSVPPMMSPSHSSNLTSPVLSHVKSEPFLLDPKTGLQSVPHPNAMRLNYSFGHGHVPTGGKPSLSMLKAQLEQRNDTSAILQERDLVLKDEVSNSSNNSSGSQTPTVKLKLMNLNRVLESGVSNSDSEEKSRTSAFDFHSDDEDFDLPMVEKITVVSASPTRLQISNKSTLASFNKFNRSEKRKQKEKALKNALSVDSGKRKRDREDKKEKKRKKINSYQGDEEVVYKSIAVEVGGDDEKPVMPKLKILKKSGKISVLSSLDVKEEKVEAKSSYVAQGKDITVSDWNEHKNTIDKDVVVNVEQIGKVLKKSDCAKGVKEKDTRHRDVEKSSDKLGIPISRTPSASDEGIFDRINAMKSESLGKNEDSNSSLERKPGSADNSPNLNHKKVSKSSSSSSSKSQKSHKRSSSSSKTDPKMKTPTIKLKQISLPTSTSSSVKVPKTPTTPGMPATPKNLSHSPTSTTIGKIGAVSLATSGSQKQLSGSSSKSPQGSSSGGKSSSRNSSSSLSKSSSSLQKSIQIQGPSGKNSPVPQSKSGHSRSLSSSGAILNSGTSKSDKLSKSLSSSNRTSSPLLEKEKSRSKSSSRDREKSTSSSKSATTPSTTPDTAADLLSFLNPKANKIASFTIPKLSSNVNTQKASTPTTSATVSIVSPTTAVTSTTTSASIVVNSVAKLSKPGSNVGKSAANSVGKTENALNKSNANRPHNLNVSITSNNSKGVNSPNSFSQRSNSVHNKSNNPNHNNQSPGFRNNGSSNNNKLSGSINNVTHSQKPGILSNGTTNQMGPLKGNSPLNGGGSKPNSASDSAMRGNPNVTNNNTNSRPPTSLVPNAPKGPGPPNSKSDSSTNFSQSDSSTKTKPDSQSPGSVKVRKGSLSAVIDKLTCKASGPVPASASSSSQTGTPVCIEEPPASPDMDSDAASEAKPAKVVVISEAPASPELDTPCSPECGVIRASRIISIPLENEPQNKGDEISSPTPSPKSLSFPDKITGPKIIPLNSVKEFAKNSSLNSSSNTKTDHFNPVSQQNGYLTNHSEALIGSNRGNNLHEPYAKDFKVPTPTKMLENSEPLRHNVVDFENLGVRRRSRSGSKASTPSSPPSSPENGLIIDFPVSPQLNLKSNSPYKVEKSGTDILRTSPNHVISPLVKMPSKLHMSSGSSPANGENASASSNENSPAFIEDDLMDEALGLGT